MLKFCVILWKGLRISNFFCNFATVFDNHEHTHENNSPFGPRVADDTGIGDGQAERA
jgi:hypothetical protein